MLQTPAVSKALIGSIGVIVRRPMSQILRAPLGSELNMNSLQSTRARNVVRAFPKDSEEAEQSYESSKMITSARRLEEDELGASQIPKDLWGYAALFGKQADMSKICSTTN